MIHTIYRDDELIVAFNGYPYTISIDDPRYDDVREAVQCQDYVELENLLSVKGRANNMLVDLAEEGITEVGGEYAYKGNPLAMDLTDYLRASLDSGEHMPIVRFIQKLFKNPSNDTREQMFTFMEKNKMPIDADGNFLAFKGVRADYYDKHTGTIYNGVGVTVPMLDWDEVDTNPENTCSRGYHACSEEYLDFWYADSDRVVSVSINPADVASIPVDYDSAKLRCRQYKVIADITDQYRNERRETKLYAPGGVNPESFADMYVRTRECYY